MFLSHRRFFPFNLGQSQLWLILGQAWLMQDLLNRLCFCFMKSNLILIQLYIIYVMIHMINVHLSVTQIHCCIVLNIP
jgi:hypothetical protein